MANHVAQICCILADLLSTYSVNYWKRDLKSLTIVDLSIFLCSSIRFCFHGFLKLIFRALILKIIRSFHCREEANSDSMLELLLWLASYCFCYYNQTEWLCPSQFPSVAQSCPTHHNPMDCSTTWEKTSVGKDCERWTRRTNNFHGSWFIIFKYSHKIFHYYHNLIYFRKDSNDPVDQNSLNLKYRWHIFHVRQFWYGEKQLRL